MPDLLSVAGTLGVVAVAAPFALLLAVGLPTLVGRPPPERAVDLLTRLAVTVGLLAALGVLAAMLGTGHRYVPVELGEWVRFGMTPADPDSGYHFHVLLVFDRLSVPLVVMTFVLCGTVGAFATRYLHREPGYHRFFVLYAVFLLGMVLAAAAGTVETLFAGWELVGLSSALLVGFFQERPAPARNALRVWVVYRVCDAALLLAAVVLHHQTGGGNLHTLSGLADWPNGSADLTSTQAAVVGGLLVFAAAGKSALVPFSGWLPRAMEGPTPSSAVFYGALSVHLGAYLLLRFAPVLDACPELAAVVIALGLVTAGYAYLVMRVQTDVKSVLSFASLCQVGLIVAEIGAGWRYVPLVHLIGHACLRTLQFVRAPSYLLERRAVEDAVGGRLPRAAGGRAWLYRFALERGYLDAVLSEYVVGPFVRLFRGLDRLERRWTDWVNGEVARRAGGVSPPCQPPASGKQLPVAGTGGLHPPLAKTSDPTEDRR